jgi:hypothetical protein
MKLHNSTVLKALLPVVAVVVLTGTAHADLMYSFDVNASGGFPALTFSFTTPTFVTVGQSPAFSRSPTTVTDGTNSWALVNDLAGQTATPAFGCFDFFTANDVTADVNCGFSGFDTSAIVSLFVGGPLPTQVGTYTLSGSETFDPGHIFLPASGQLVITSTTVPEPSALVLLSSALVAVGLFLLQKQRWNPACG